ncbi:MAG: hypothetical protein KAQ84_02580 [Thermoplasmatales archaeon]|nr:hypothetical protein [Thermoplasmatales archaeon]MCK5260853.1 hypothetical protein [Thermoplasmatales archaeon]
MIGFIELEQTKGTLETLMVLLKKGDTRSTYLIKSISASRETFYKIVKILKKYGLVKKLYIEDQDILIWSLTPKGKEIAKLLIEIEKKLNP